MRPNLAIVAAATNHADRRALADERAHADLVMCVQGNAAKFANVAPAAVTVPDWQLNTNGFASDEEAPWDTIQDTLDDHVRAAKETLAHIGALRVADRAALPAITLIHHHRTALARVSAVESAASVAAAIRARVRAAHIATAARISRAGRVAAATSAAALAGLPASS
ncbi:MAG: hypothetical protein ACYCYN_03030 [Solirubrobacteraceae bacterium]